LNVGDAEFSSAYPITLLKPVVFPYRKNSSSLSEWGIIVYS